MDHASIIQKLGGYAATADLLGAHKARAHHWLRDGIPMARWPDLVAKAAEAGHHGITFEALLIGRPARHPASSQAER